MQSKFWVFLLPQYFVIKFLPSNMFVILDFAMCIVKSFNFLMSIS
jgi:hypothetical protein